MKEVRFLAFSPALLYGEQVARDKDIHDPTVTPGIQIGEPEPSPDREGHTLVRLDELQFDIDECVLRVQQGERLKIIDPETGETVAALVSAEDLDRLRDTERSEEERGLRAADVESHPLILAIDGYISAQPIPVTMERGGKSDWVAHFVEANISMSGESEHDARVCLADDIVAAFQVLLAEESSLGPEMATQLAVLKKYLTPA